MPGPWLTIYIEHHCKIHTQVRHHTGPLLERTLYFFKTKMIEIHKCHGLIIKLCIYHLLLFFRK